MLRQILLKSLAATGLALFTTLSWNTAPSLSQYGRQNAVPSEPQNPRPSESTSDKLTFSCLKSDDPTSEEQIPTTVAWVPERQSNLSIIGWKSEYFGKTMSTQERCEQVTQKFQTLYDNGQLNYLTTGESQGYPIICGVAALSDECNASNQLFTLKPHGNHEEVLTQLRAMFGGQNLGVIIQSTGKLYVSMEELYKNLPPQN